MLLYEVIEETISIKLPFLLLVTVSLINLNIFSVIYGQQQTASPNANIPNEGASKPIVHVIIEGTENADKIKGGKGADTFMCDVADKILDFKSAEGDNKIGECSVIDKSLPSLP